MNEYKIICDVDEITEEDILNRVSFKTNYSSKCFRILKSSNNFYYIHCKTCGGLPSFVTTGNTVKFWKTLNGVKRAIKKFAINKHWGFTSDMFPCKNLPTKEKI